MYILFLQSYITQSYDMELMDDLQVMLSSDFKLQASSYLQRRYHYAHHSQSTQPREIEFPRHFFQAKAKTSVHKYD